MKSILIFIIILLCLITASLTIKEYYSDNINDITPVSLTEYNNHSQWVSNKIKDQDDKISKINMDVFKIHNDLEDVFTFNDDLKKISIDTQNKNVVISENLINQNKNISNISKNILDNKNELDDKLNQNKTKISLIDQLLNTLNINFSKHKQDSEEQSKVTSQNISSIFQDLSKINTGINSLSRELEKINVEYLKIKDASSTYITRTDSLNYVDTKTNEINNTIRPLILNLQNITQQANNFKILLDTINSQYVTKQQLSSIIIGETSPVTLELKSLEDKVKNITNNIANITATLGTFLTKTEGSQFVKNSELLNYAKKTDIANVANNQDLVVIRNNLSILTSNLNTFQSKNVIYNDSGFVTNSAGITFNRIYNTASNGINLNDGIIINQSNVFFNKPIIGSNSMFHSVIASNVLINDALNIRDSKGTIARIMSKDGYWGVSDSNLKTNIKELDLDSSKITQLRPVSYTFKNDSESKKRFGFIAQDVEKIYPNIIKTLPNNLKAINYEELIPITIGAVNKLIDNTNPDELCIKDVCLSSTELRKIKQIIK